MPRFILVNAAHMVIRYYKKMKVIYSKIVRRLGKNRANVAIARILAETIWTMISRGIAFMTREIALQRER